MKFCIVGAGRRTRDIYIPILSALPDVEIGGIYSRTLSKAQELALNLGIKAYSEIGHVLEDPSIDCIIACVDWSENAHVYQQVAKSNKACLLETPLGHDKESIALTFEALNQREGFTCVAEQYHLRPIEVLKRQILASGVLGELVYAYNSGVGHEYHGVSLLRSYVGYDKTLTKVVSMQRDAPYFEHISHSGIYFPGERIFNSILEFSSGVQATFHWSWLNYKSPIRAIRSSGFYTTKGSALGAECLCFIDHEGLAKQIQFNRRTLLVKGTEVLVEIVATLDSEPIARWSNPFYRYNFNEDQIVAAFFVQNLLHGGADNKIEPIYPVSRAYQDHMIVNKMYDALI